jgi:hypothetical protein
MDDRRAEATLIAVREWQRDTRVRPLLCGADSRHRLLEAVERDGRVILRCPDCEYHQSYIPSSVLHAFWTGALQRR